MRVMPGHPGRPTICRCSTSGLPARRAWPNACCTRSRRTGSKIRWCCRS